MALWTFLQDTFTNEPDNDAQMQTDGDYLYWYNVDFGISQYDPGTDTEVEIYTDGTAPIAFIWDFTIFNNEIYILGSETGTGHSTVFKWDGTPNNWTVVATVTEDVTAGTFGFILSNADQIAAVHVDYNEATEVSAGIHSSDGASWSVSSFATDPIVGTGSPSYSRHKQIHGSRPLVQQFCTVNNRPTNTNCLARASMLFSGSGWTDIINPIVDGSDECRIISPIDDQLWTWALDGVTSRYAEKADDDLLNQITPDEDVEAILSANTNWQFGIASDGGTGTLVVRWLSGVWNSLDTATADIATRDAAGGETSVCVLDNGNAYMLLHNLNTFATEIWERSEPIVTTLNRLWIYKTTDHGASFSSRGVVT